MRKFLCHVATCNVMPNNLRGIISQFLPGFLFFIFIFILQRLHGDSTRARCCVARLFCTLPQCEMWEAVRNRCKENPVGHNENSGDKSVKLRVNIQACHMEELSRGREVLFFCVFCFAYTCFIGLLLLDAFCPFLSRPASFAESSVRFVFNICSSRHHSLSPPLFC